jgi:hypothetical protein
MDDSTHLVVHKSPIAPVPPAMTELRRAVRAAGIEGLVDLSRSEPLPSSDGRGSTRRRVG